MSKVYFAKFNINSEIYDVYSGKKELKSLLNKIYVGLNEDIELSESTGTFKFTSLNKENNLVVNGRLVFYGPGTHTSYDPEKGDIEEYLDEHKARYIVFSFDIENEIVGFVPQFGFGHNQFLKRFGALVEGCADIGEVQLYLESDIESFEERIKHLKRVSEINVELIPPNNDREDFKALFGSEAEELEETGATKFFFKLTASSKKKIKTTSAYVKRLIKGVGLGYGKMTVYGENTSHDKVTIKSMDDTPYLRPIADSEKTSIPEVAEKTRAGINDLQRLKTNLRVRETEQSNKPTK